MRAATSHGYTSTNKLDCSAQACPADGSKGPWRKKPWWQFWFCSYMGNNNMVTGSHQLLSHIIPNAVLLLHSLPPFLAKHKKTCRSRVPPPLHPSFWHNILKMIFKWCNPIRTCSRGLCIYFTPHIFLWGNTASPGTEKPRASERRHYFQDCTHLIKSQFLPPKRHSSTLPTFWGQEQWTLSLDKAMEPACCLIEIIILRPSCFTGNFCW